MKLSYFKDTDTLYIELKEAEAAGYRDLDENTILDLDSEGNMIAITMEHASQRTDLGHLTLSGIAA